VGFHTELPAHLGMRSLGKKLDVKYQPVTSQNRIPLVQNGTVDIECGSTTNNAARQKDVAFADTTYVEVRIAVKANSGITGIKELNGKTVATTTGTTSVQPCASTSAPRVDFKEVFGKDHADSFLLLESGRADAFVMDAHPGRQHRQAKNPADFKIVGEVLSVEPIACMMRKDDPAFKKAGTTPSSESSRASWPSCTTSGSCSHPAEQRAVGLPASEATKDAWANPNDKPMEDYAKK
jgi:glutamate/aspartate transport system substrate-binding protein